LVLKTLEYLEAVYKYKSFTKAAEVLYVSQPAISAAINTLEKELAVELIIRNSKIVKFTNEGEFFIVRVNKILSEIRQVELEMNDFSVTANKTLRLGISSSPSISSIHEYLYKDFLPNLASNEKVYIDENSAYNHIEKVKADILDICFNGIPYDIDLTSFETIPLISDEVRIIVHRNHKLAKYNKISLDMINGIDFATMGEDSLMFKYFNRKCKEQGIFYHEISRHSNMTSYLKIVSAGVCAGIVAFDKNSDVFMDEMYKNSSIVILPFEDPIDLSIGFICKKSTHLSLLARRFIQNVKLILV